MAVMAFLGPVQSCPKPFRTKFRSKFGPWTNSQAGLVSCLEPWTNMTISEVVIAQICWAMMQ